MTIAIVQSDLATASAASVTATFPSSGTATADNLLLAIHSVASASAVTTPTGYTLVDGPYTHFSNKQLNVFAKKAVGGETGVSVTQPNTRGQVEIFEISGMSTADIDDIIAGSLSLQSVQSNTGGAGSLAVGSIDPTQTGEVMMVAAFVLDNTPNVNPPTWTDSYVTTETAPTGCRQWSGTFIGTNLGALAPTCTFHTVSRQALSTHFVLPAASGPPPDTTDPTVAIDAVHGAGEATSVHDAAGYDADTETLTITGTASDDTAVTSVEVRIDGGSWVAASNTGTDYSTWEYDLDLTTLDLADVHTIEARADDAAANQGVATSVDFHYSPSGLWGFGGVGGHLVPVDVEVYGN